MVNVKIAILFSMRSNISISKRGMNLDVENAVVYISFECSIGLSRAAHNYWVEYSSGFCWLLTSGSIVSFLLLFFIVIIIII